MTTARFRPGSAIGCGGLEAMRKLRPVTFSASVYELPTCLSRYVSRYCPACSENSWCVTCCLVFWSSTFPLGPTNVLRAINV